MIRQYDRALSVKELAERSDSEIDTSDIPILDESFWNKAQVNASYTKNTVSIRLSDDVIGQFNSR